MSRRMLDPAAAALLRALKPLLGAWTLEEAETMPWASATFVGAQHRLRVTAGPDLTDEEIAAVAATLPQREFALPKLLVAEIVAERHARTLAIEALILEEA